jgi:methylated-DNA-[protein]-cysteine S-methyltransferase
MIETQAIETQATHTMSYTQIESPVGPLRLVADEDGLRRLDFVNGRNPVEANPQWHEDAEPLRETIRQLRAYFAGELEAFDLTLAPEGTPFQLSVWNCLCEIPFGETISYGELARRVGNPNASRAVGLANGSNPIAIVIPCHRVIGSNGKLTGYGGGLPIKEKLLGLERRQLRLL